MKKQHAILAAIVFLAAFRSPASAAVSPQADLGPRAPGAATAIVAVLPHRNQSQLDALLLAIARGRSRPITHAQFVATYAPDPQSVARVASYLRGNGFSVVRTTEDMVFASAPAETVERAFSTTIHNVRNGHGSDTYEAMSAAHVPAAMAGALKTIVVDDAPLAWVR